MMPYIGYAWEIVAVALIVAGLVDGFLAVRRGRR